jgi:hypothetical protein
LECRWPMWPVGQVAGNCPGLAVPGSGWQRLPAGATWPSTRPTPGLLASRPSMPKAIFSTPAPNWSSQNATRSVYAPRLRERYGWQTRAPGRKRSGRRTRSDLLALPSSAACWTLREPALPALLGRGNPPRRAKWLLGRPLRRVLRSGAYLGPGAGTCSRLPGIHRPQAPASPVVNHRATPAPGRVCGPFVRRTADTRSLAATDCPASEQIMSDTAT